jgi:site-specific recombinase XerD
LELGVNPKVVAELLGHKKVATTLDMYSHVSLEVKKGATVDLYALLRGERPYSEQVAQ